MRIGDGFSHWHDGHREDLLALAGLEAWLAAGATPEGETRSEPAGHGTIPPSRADGSSTTGPTSSAAVQRVEGGATPEPTNGAPDAFISMSPVV